jgi:hypothetical protein
MTERYEEIFADTIGRVDYMGNHVRIELASLHPSADGKGQPTLEPNGNRIVMPLEGFLHAFSTLGNLLNRLEEDKVITRKPAAGAEGQGGTGEGA